MCQPVAATLRDGACAAREGLRLGQAGLAVEVFEHGVMREHDGAIPAGWAAGFPGQPHLAVQVFALAGRQGVAVEREAVSAIVHAPAPHGPARRIAQPGGGAHVAVMPPEGNAPFDFLRGRDVVAQAQVQGVLHGVVKARCAKQRARTQGGVQVIPNSLDRKSVV